MPTIISRSQCFFVPSFKHVDYSYDLIAGVFTDYWNFNRKDVFDISQKLNDMTKEHSVLHILESMQNYILVTLKSNPKYTNFIKHIEYVEQAKLQAQLGIRPINIFDELCLKLIH